MLTSEKMQTTLLATEEESKVVHEEYEYQGVSSRQNVTVFKNSPFYQVLLELQKGVPSTQLPRISTINKDLRQAFLIHLDSFPPRHVFPEYNFKERHFSVDKFYRKTSKDSRHGYTPIHYTESYFSQGTGETITIHVYLDKQGQYVYSQIKKKNLEGLEEAIDGKTADEVSKPLMENVSASISTLSFLFTAKQKLYSKYKDSADKLELELFELSKKLNATSFEVYKLKTIEFIKAIKELNRYVEFNDSRDRLIAKRLKSLEEWVKKIKEASKKTTPDLIEDESSTVPSSEEVSDLTESQELSGLESLYETIIEQLKQLKKQLPKGFSYCFKNLEQIQKNHELCTRTNELLGGLFEFPNDFLKEKLKNGKLKKIISESFHLIAEHDKKSVAFLEQQALEGNLEAVEPLFELFSSKLSQQFYIELIEKLITEKNQSKKKKLVEICEFFNKNSEDYRNAIFNISNQKRYFLSREELNQAFSKTKKEILDSLGESCEASVLFKLYSNKDLSTFNMLLRHGANPNTWGMIGENQREACSIFSIILTFNNGDYETYLKSLIRYRADPNLLITAKEKRSILQEKLSNTKKYNRLGLPSASSSQIYNLNQTKKMASTLMICIGRNAWGLFDYFLPYISADNLACVLAQLGKDKDLSCIQRSTNSSDSMLNFEKSQKIALEKAKTFEQGPFPNCFFYEKNEKFNMLFEMLKKTYNFLVKKLIKINSKEFDELYQKLINDGIQLSLLNEPKKAHHCFFGSYFLLISYAENLNSEKEKLELFDKYYAEWFKRISDILPKVYPNYPDVVKTTIRVYENWGVEIRKAVKARVKTDEVSSLSSSLTSIAMEAGGERDNKNKKDIPSVNFEAQAECDEETVMERVIALSLTEGIKESETKNKVELTFTEAEIKETVDSITIKLKHEVSKASLIKEIWENLNGIARSKENIETAVDKAFTALDLDDTAKKKFKGELINKLIKKIPKPLSISPVVGEKVAAKPLVLDKSSSTSSSQQSLARETGPATPSAGLPKLPLAIEFKINLEQGEIEKIIYSLLSSQCSNQQIRTLATQICKTLNGNPISMNLKVERIKITEVIEKSKVDEIRKLNLTEREQIKQKIIDILTAKMLKAALAEKPIPSSKSPFSSSIVGSSRDVDQEKASPALTSLRPSTTLDKTLPSGSSRLGRKKQRSLVFSPQATQLPGQECISGSHLSTDKPIVPKGGHNEGSKSSTKGRGPGQKKRE